MAKRALSFKQIKILLIGLMCLLHTILVAQQQELDSLTRLLPVVAEDTNRINVLHQLCRGYWFNDTDKSEKYGLEAEALAKKLDSKEKLALSYRSLSATYAIRGDNEKAMNMIDASERLYLELNNEGELAKVYNNKGNIYFIQGHYQESIETLLKALEINERLDRKLEMIQNFSNLGIKYMTMDHDSMALAYLTRALDIALAEARDGRGSEATLAALYQNRGSLYVKTKQFDSAIADINHSLALALKIDDNHKMALNYADLADIKYAQKEYDQSLTYIQEAIVYYKKMNNLVDRNMAEIIVAENWTHLGKTAEAIGLARQCLQEAIPYSWLENVRRASLLIMQNYETMSDYDSAFKYQEIYVKAKDSLFNREKNQAIASLQGTYALSKKDRENELLLRENRSQRFTLVMLLFIALLAVAIAYIFFRSRKREKISRQLLDEKNAQIETQNLELARTINDLKRTQAQLVQSEKMASLGMLSTGITGEINAPVGFISSDVAQLEKTFDELRGGGDESYTMLCADIQEVIGSINVGVRRTSDIISGLKTFGKPGHQVTVDVDIHRCLDSALSILKSKLAGITVHKDYQPLPPIACQEGQISQVFLNIIDNAIQAIEEKKSPGQIHVSTYVKNGYVVVSIRDNGTGIPKSVQPQVFDPFFTTKDVGQGTGLGLSISYSIIKNHGGSLRFVSSEGEGTEFVVKLLHTDSLADADKKQMGA